MRSEAPLYRERLIRRAAENDNLDKALHVGQLFHAVFGTPQGALALDYICQVLCQVDDAVITTDPMAAIEFNSRRNIGIAIARLALMPYDVEKPEVKG